MLLLLLGLLLLLLLLLWGAGCRIHRCDGFVDELLFELLALLLVLLLLVMLLLDEVGVKDCLRYPCPRRREL